MIFIPDYKCPDRIDKFAEPLRLDTLPTIGSMCTKYMRQVEPMLESGR